MKGKITSVLIIISSFSFGQNLVPNGSFEEFINCPNTDMAPEDCPPWFTPTDATSDVFNRCNPMGFDSLMVCPLDTGNTYLDPWNWAVPINFLGCQDPHSGDGYAGIFLYHGLPWREYLQVPLIEDLVEGESYFVQVYVSCADRMHYATDAFHFGFVSDSIHYDTEFNINFGIDLQNIQGNILDDQEDWMEISGIYMADGSEKYLVMGNFMNDEDLLLDSINPMEDYYLSAYYYVDDVYVGKSNGENVNDNLVNNQVTLLSNPIRSDLLLEYDFSSAGWNVEIINTMGEIVIEKSPLEQSYNLSHLSNGYYILRTFKNNEFQKTYSFIKSH